MMARWWPYPSFEQTTTTRRGCAGSRLRQTRRARRLVTKRSKGGSVLLDMRPLQGPSAARGVGTYAAGLLGGLIAEGFDSRLTLLLDSGLEEPSLPKGQN